MQHSQKKSRKKHLVTVFVSPFIMDYILFILMIYVPRIFDLSSEFLCTHMIALALVWTIKYNLSPLFGIKYCSKKYSVLGYAGTENQYSRFYSSKSLFSKSSQTPSYPIGVGCVYEPVQVLTLIWEPQRCKSSSLTI